MMERPLPLRWIAKGVAAPWFLAAVAVGLALGGLLVGYEPVGGVPDRISRPIKTELARALKVGELPYWSDRIGLGVPLVAESQVAAFYPPNQVFYRWLSVPTAYRLGMWLHYLACALATYAYARFLSLTPWGAALAAVSFTLCGFQAAHNGQEWAYHTVAYLPFVLLLAERFLARGHLGWLAALALAWAAQLTLGHFQVAAWTGILVLITGAYRVFSGRLPWWRGLALPVGLAWGAGAAVVQLGLTGELAQFAGFGSHSASALATGAFPPARWAELALPRFFAGLSADGGSAVSSWGLLGKSASEACFYIGTIPLILAFVGLAAAPRERSLGPWRLVICLSLALATLPVWAGAIFASRWPSFYEALLQVPGLGLFRAPGRYTVLASFGLALLAGRGLDRTTSSGRFRLGVGLAISFAVTATAWALWLAQSKTLSSVLLPDLFAGLMAQSGVAWVVSIAAIVAWRQGKVGAWVLLALATIELGSLYYQGETQWGWSNDNTAAASPALDVLGHEKGVGRVAGPLTNLPLSVGLTPAASDLGILAPAPNGWLQAATTHQPPSDPVTLRLLRRYGVTHGIWETPASGSETVWTGPDHTLDRLAERPAGVPEHARWLVVRYPGAFPPIRIALRTAVARDERALVERLSQLDSPDDSCVLQSDRPSDEQEPEDFVRPRALEAKILAWDNNVGVVEHDGSCDLVFTRAFYPGWEMSINYRPWEPVFRCDGGLQAVRLPGETTAFVKVRYRPTNLFELMLASFVATTLALFVVAYSLVRVMVIAKAKKLAASRAEKPAASAPAGRAELEYEREREREREHELVLALHARPLTA